MLDRTKTLKRGAAALVLTLATAASLSAQTRITLPTGTVFVVRTEQPLQSATAKVGDTFTTTVLEDVSVNGYTVIPANSQIQGVVAYVQPATRQNSGVMQVKFDRLTVGSRSFPIAGKLTSTDSTQRRQIDQRADSRVVLVGERGGLGAVIAGANGSNSPASGILSALGGMLSEGRDVDVPAGSQFAVQLEQSAVLSARGAANLNDESTIFTASERIMAAQRALAQRSYYRGAATGTLDNATRRALFEFQLDNNLTATGNLDGRTAQALGILRGRGNASGAVLSANDASLLRRNAQDLAARLRQDLGISTDGRMRQSSNITEADMDLLFTVSSFADNASVYERLVLGSGSTDGTAMASRSLLKTARNVDAALQQARLSIATQNVWQTIRQQLGNLDPAYR